MVLSAAADCPFLPRDLVSRAASGAERRMRRARGRRIRRPVASGDRPVERAACATSCATRLWWRTSGRSTAGPRAIRSATVTWPTTPLDPFFNANTMDDIAEAERLAALDGRLVATYPIEPVSTGDHSISQAGSPSRKATNRRTPFG